MRKENPVRPLARHRLKWLVTPRGLIAFLLPQILCAVIFSSSSPASPRQDEALLSLMEQVESSYAQINDYQAIFHKQERVEGTLLPEETILLKFQKPLKIYMKWIGEPLNGMEALFVQGINDNKVLAHRGGILSAVTLSLDPKGAIAMKGNRHPITEAGFGFIIREMRRNIDKALQHGEDLEIIRIAEEAVKDRSATVVEARFRERGGRKYYASHIVVHIDKELKLPIVNAFYDDKDALFEQYTFEQVRLNIGFTTKDFSRDNEDYKF